MEETTVSEAEGSGGTVVVDVSGIEERLDLMYVMYVEMLEEQKQLQTEEAEYYHTKLEAFDSKLTAISEGCTYTNELTSNSLVSELSFVPLLGIIAGLIFIDIFWRK